MPKSIYKVIGLSLLLFFMSCRDESPSISQPNIIFILVDDLGKEWISTYGGQLVQTPNIDSLAARGIKFNRAYSMPQCTPSRVALLTGQYPYHNGWINHFDVPRWGHGARFDPVFNLSFPTLLQKNGYHTAAAGKWQINDFRLEPEAMVYAGFDEYCMWTGGEGGNEAVSDERYWNPYIQTKKGSKTYPGKFGPDIFTEFIIDFINDNREDPFFVYYPMVLTHTPLVHTPHKPQVTSAFDKHVAMVEYTDYLVGKIFAAVKDLDLDDNTYIFFTTDNGTARSIIGQRNNQFVTGGKAYLTENGINAPFIVYSPKQKEETMSDFLVDFTDIAPTILDLAGVSDQGLKMDGKSLADFLEGKKKFEKRSWISSLGSHPAQIDSTGKIKPFHRFRDRIISNEKYKAYIDTSGHIIRIFDLQADPLEKINLINTVDNNVLEDFNSILQQMPRHDQAPKYSQLDTSYFDIEVDRLNTMSAKAHQNNQNMRSHTTEEAFKKFKESN